MSNSSAGVVVGTVAWAEVASSADTKIGDWDATKMCADSEADKVFLVLASFGIGLLISKGGNVDGVHVVDLFLDRKRVRDKFLSILDKNDEMIMTLIQLMKIHQTILAIFFDFK